MRSAGDVGGAGGGTDDLLSKLASEEIDRLLAEEVEDFPGGVESGADALADAVAAEEGGRVAELLAGEVERDVVNAVIRGAGGQLPVDGVVGGKEAGGQL